MNGRQRSRSPATAGATLPGDSTRKPSSNLPLPRAAAPPAALAHAPAAVNVVELERRLAVAEHTVAMLRERLEASRRGEAAAEAAAARASAAAVASEAAGAAAAAQWAQERDALLDTVAEMHAAAKAAAGSPTDTVAELQAIQTELLTTISAQAASLGEARSRAATAEAEAARAARAAAAAEEWAAAAAVGGSSASANGIASDTLPPRESLARLCDSAAAEARREAAAVAAAGLAAARETAVSLAAEVAAAESARATAESALNSVRAGEERLRDSLPPAALPLLLTGPPPTRVAGGAMAMEHERAVAELLLEGDWAAVLASQVSQVATCGDGKSMHLSPPSLAPALALWLRAALVASAKRLRLAESEAADLRDEVALLRAGGDAEAVRRSLASGEAAAALRAARDEREHAQAEAAALSSRLADVNERMARYRERVLRARNAIESARTEAAAARAAGEKAREEAAAATRLGAAAEAIAARLRAEAEAEALARAALVRQEREAHERRQRRRAERTATDAVEIAAHVRRARRHEELLGGGDGSSSIGFVDGTKNATNGPWRAAAPIPRVHERHALLQQPPPQQTSLPLPPPPRQYASDESVSLTSDGAESLSLGVDSPSMHATSSGDGTISINGARPTADWLAAISSGSAAAMSSRGARARRLKEWARRIGAHAPLNKFEAESPAEQASRPLPLLPRKPASDAVALPVWRRADESDSVDITSSAATAFRAPQFTAVQRTSAATEKFRALRPRRSALSPSATTSSSAVQQRGWR